MTPQEWRPIGISLGTPTIFLPSRAFNLLSFIANKRTLSLARRAMEPGHLLHSPLTRAPGGNARHLKSRHPVLPAIHQLISSSYDNNRTAAPLADHQWNAEWLENTTRLRTSIPGIDTHPPGMALPRTAWVRLNRFRTGVGRFRSCLHKWVWPLLQLVSVRQNRPFTMWSCNVQSIDLPMAWRFWMAKQSKAAQHLPRDPCGLEVGWKNSLKRWQRSNLKRISKMLTFPIGWNFADDYGRKHSVCDSWTAQYLSWKILFS